MEINIHGGNSDGKLGGHDVEITSKTLDSGVTITTYLFREYLGREVSVSYFDYRSPPVEVEVEQ